MLFRKLCVKRGHFDRNVKEEKMLAMQRIGRVLGRGLRHRAPRQAWCAGPALAPP